MPDQSTPGTPDEPRSHLGLYRAGLTSPEHRRYITVARADVVDDTLETLRGNASKKSKHHYLFIGPRGIGKTHLLSLIEDRIAEDEVLAQKYVVARFPEESGRTRSFADFLLGLCEILKSELPDEPVWGKLHRQLQTEEDDTIIVDTIVPVIRKENRTHKRTLLITLENLNDIFTSQIRSRPDIGALRKFLMDGNGCLLIATAPVHFDAITDVKKPFYDFFDTQVLENLSEQQTIELVRKNLEWDQRQDLLDDFTALRLRLQALYRMTGGSPRLIVMLYELIAHESITSVQTQFRILLDRITPFYQDRLKELGPQERAVVETMAVMRDQEKTPAAIAARMRQSPQQTSALLKRLLKSRYLQAQTHPRDKRSRLYTIREGFFDIWLAMNLSRGARRRLPFVLDFFNIYYPTLEEREQKRTELRQRHKDADDPDARQALDYLTEVGDDTEKAVAKLQLADHFRQRGDLSLTRQYLIEARTLEVDPLGGWIISHTAESPLDYMAELQSMVESWELYRSGDLEAFGSKLAELGGSLNGETWSQARLAFLRDHLELLEDERQRVDIQFQIAHVLEARGELEEALRIWREEALPVYKRLNDERWTAIVQLRIGDVLFVQGEPDEALRLWREETLAVFDELGDEMLVAVTQGKIADVLHDRGELDEALRIRREEQLPVYERLGDVRSKAVTQGKIADVLQDRGELDEALRIRREESLPVFERLGATRDLLLCRWHMAGYLLKRNASGDRNEAAELLRQAHTTAERMRIPEADKIRELMEREGF